MMKKVSSCGELSDIGPGLERPFEILDDLLTCIRTPNSSPFTLSLLSQRILRSPILVEQVFIVFIDVAVAIKVAVHPRIDIRVPVDA